MDNFDFLQAARSAGFDYIKLRRRFIIILVLLIIFNLLLPILGTYSYGILLFQAMTLIFILIVFHYSSVFVYKIEITDDQLIILLPPKTVSFRLSDIERIRISKWFGGGAYLRMIYKKTDARLSKKSFLIPAGGVIDEGEKLLVRMIKRIGPYITLEYTKPIKNRIEFWNKFDK